MPNSKARAGVRSRMPRATFTSIYEWANGYEDEYRVRQVEYCRGSGLSRPGVARVRLTGGDAGFEELVVVGFVEAPSLGLDLPLDVRGTAFQQRVWQAVRESPAGST